jgi:hypothetical protein
MPTNRELLLERKRKKERGLPAAPIVPKTPGRSARGPRTGGGKGTTGRGLEKKAGQKVLAEQPEAVEGIKGIVTPGIAGVGSPRAIAGGKRKAQEVAGALGFLPDPVKSEVKAETPGISSTKGIPTLEKFQEEIPTGTGQASAVERAVGAKQGTGGFVFHEPGSGRGSAGKPVFKSGLPTNRLPSFGELGGAIGSVFKFVADISKFNRARGLVPGTDAQRGKETGVTGGLKQKDILSSLTKQLETATLAGSKEEQASLKSRIEALISGQDAGAFDRQSDTDAILNS